MRGFLYKEMVRKLKRSVKASRVSVRQLALCDRFMFRRTCIDAEMVSRLGEYTVRLMGDGEAVKSESVRAAIGKELGRLRGFGFNNVYEYLEALCDVLKSDTHAVTIALELMQTWFGNDCVKLQNMYSKSDGFDM